MIVDTLKNAPVYAHVHAGIRRGLEFLGNFDPSTGDGRVEIDGDSVFALVQSYQTDPAAGKPFESHRKYLDIQYVVEGVEVIEVTPVERLTPTTSYDGQKDFLLYDGKAESTRVLLRPGDFAVFFPEDGHKPGCQHLTPAPVKKVVVKVLC